MDKGERRDSHCALTLDPLGARLFDQRGPFGQCTQLGIGDTGVDGAKACEGAKAAITASYHPFVTDNIDKSLNALCHQFWMLNKIRCCVHHACNQNLCIRYIGLPIAKNGLFMPVARI